jgi:predicted ATPase/class 3 adenylate cyclase
MTFDEILDQAIAILQRRGRVTYRTLKRQFQLDDEAWEDLKEALLYSHSEVVNDEGRGLIWTGKAEAPEPGAHHEGDEESRFHELILIVIGLLQCEKRVTYRRLKYILGRALISPKWRRQVGATLVEEIRDELAFRRLAFDEHGTGLVWIGAVQSAVPPPVAIPRQPSSADATTVSVHVAPTQPLPVAEANPHFPQEAWQSPAAVTPEPVRNAPEAEHRQITVMFCDLADSTKLSQQLDPEDLRDVMRSYQQTSAEVIQRYDGTVAQHLGDGLLIYFGWPVAHEDDARRALHAGLEIVDAIITTLNPRLETEKGVHLTVRLGVHTGAVVVGEMGGGGRHETLATGETVNIAARLEGLALPNTVVISHGTERLVRGAFALESLGMQTLKGIAEPMQVFRVLGPAGVHYDKEETLLDRGAFLIGRDEEVGLLFRRWEQSKEGLGQAVLISGEAGIGKSSLVTTMRAHVAQEGYTRLTFRCSPYYTNSTLYPMIAHLEHMLGFGRHDSPDDRLNKLEQAIRTTRLSLHEAVPLMASLLAIPLTDRYVSPASSPQQQRQQTLDTLVGWLLEEAGHQPVLAVWEDLHWADPSTLEMLGLILKQTPTVPMLSLLTSRPEFEPPWPSRSYMTPITLNRLGRPQVETLISHLAGGKVLPDEVVQHIVAKTDGVPLYVEELTKMLLESDQLQEEAEQYVLTGSLRIVAIPDTLQDSLMARLDQFHAAKELAQLGSVLGREFTYEMLKIISSQDEQAVQTGLAQLVEAELLLQRGRPPRATYIFKHALIRDAAYASLLRRTRQQVHQHVAQQLEIQFPDVVAIQPELVAYHYTQSSHQADAIPYLLKAAEHAQTVWALEEALQYLQDATALLDTLDHSSTYVQYRIEVLFRQERLYDTLGRREQQQTLIAQLFALLQYSDDTARLAEVYVRQGDLYTQVGRFDEAEQALEAALHLRRGLADTAGESHVLRSLGFLRWHQDHYAEALVHNEAALVLDRQRNDHMSVATDLTNLGAVLRSLGDPERALACLQEALGVYETTQHHTKQAFTLYSMANIHREMRVLEHAMQQYQQAYDIFVAHRDRQMASRALAGMASILWEQGKTQESLALYHDVLHMTRETQHGQSLAHTLRTLGELLVTVEEPQQALRYLHESTTVYAELEDYVSAASMWVKIARIHEQHGEHDQDALTAWEKVRDLYRQAGNSRGTLEALQQMARLARQHLGDLGQAMQYLCEAVQLTEDLEDTVTQGELCNTMGIIAWQQERFPEALAYYERALQLYRHMRDTAHTGVILNSIGVTLRCMRRYDEALAHLQEAVTANRQVQQRLYEGYGLAAIGDVYRDLGNNAQARIAYQDSLKIRQEIGDRRGEGWMLVAIAQTYAAQDVHAEAQRYIDAALAIAAQGEDEDLRRACRRIQDACSDKQGTEEEGGLRDSI